MCIGPTAHPKSPQSPLAESTIQLVSSFNHCTAPVSPQHFASPFTPSFALQHEDAVVPTQSWPLPFLIPPSPPPLPPHAHRAMLVTLSSRGQMVQSASHCSPTTSLSSSSRGAASAVHSESCPFIVRLKADFVAEHPCYPSKVWKGWD